MDEIKFRAWNVATKTMTDLKKATPFILNIDTNGLFLPFSDGLKLMQYTGSDDKDDIEIYKDDIVKNDGCGYFNFDAKIVEFKYSMFCIKTEKNQPYWPLYLFDSLEVIGNIHQHSHLII